MINLASTSASATTIRYRKQLFFFVVVFCYNNWVSITLWLWHLDPQMVSSIEDCDIWVTPNSIRFNCGIKEAQHLAIHSKGP